MVFLYEVKTRLRDYFTYKQAEMITHLFSAFAFLQSNPFPDLPKTVDTGSVTFRVPHSLKVVFNDKIQGCDRTIWFSEWGTRAVELGPQDSLVVMMMRIRFTDVVWKTMGVDATNLRDIVISNVQQQGKEVNSLWSDVDRESIENVYRKVRDPRKIFGTNGVRFAAEAINPNLPAGSNTGFVSSGGMVFMNDPSGKYLSGTAYISDQARKTQYVIQVSKPGSTDFNLILPAAMRIVMSAEAKQ